MKCKVFLWSFDQGGVSLNDFSEFQDVFCEEACNELAKFLPEEETLALYELNDFDPYKNGFARIYQPIEFYDESKSQPMFDTIDSACDEYLGGWDFEEEGEEDVL